MHVHPGTAAHALSTTLADGTIVRGVDQERSSFNGRDIRHIVDAETRHERDLRGLGLLAICPAAQLANQDL